MDPKAKDTDATLKNEVAPKVEQSPKADTDAFIISDFNDANFADSGKERRFTSGSVEALPTAIFENYKHVNLVRAATADDKKAAA